MKKSVIKFSVFFLFFLIALVVVSKIMNRGHDNLTMDMAPATLPLVTMAMDGTEYNQLHGYTGAMDIAFQRDFVTVLGESRDTDFVVDTYGENVTGISFEVRSIDGSRLIENTEVRDFQITGNQIRGRLTLKDLIERDVEYSLTILLELEESRQVFYYTRVIWSSGNHAMEKLNFVIDFHEKLYDKEAARDLTKYLETNARLEDNSSFHKVNIYSSFRQITWGSLDVTEVMGPAVRLKEITEETASLLVDYVVAVAEGKDATYYTVEEYFRLRYTTDRMYLLSYERTMTQIPNAEEMYANDKILLGITGTDIAMTESEDGNIVVFEVANQLFSYDVTNNRLTEIFSFYDEDNADARTMYGQHAIRILDVLEGGNVQFAVYGYMNRGRHEGEVGIQVYTYNSAQNTIEELLYISYDKSYAALAAEMNQLLYLNREQKLYLLLDNAVYGIDLVGRTYSPLLAPAQDETLLVSNSHKIAVWSEGEDIYHSTALNIRNFSMDTQKTLTVEAGEAIRPLGFMEEDIIYGVARIADIVELNTGQVFYPMYKICICNSSGELLKEYEQRDIYVTGCAIVDNQITLDRVERLESGEYRETEQEHITNNMEVETGRNVIVTADIDTYERYVQIQVRKEIDSRTIKLLNPREVVFEGGRSLELPERENSSSYYVYGPYGIDGIFLSPANAVDFAYSIPGVITDEKGEYVWLKENRAARNQIMAIKEAAATEDKSALAVCLDTILAYEGISRNSQYLLNQGKSAVQILEENMESASVLDLTGCSLDAVLYYVNRDIPVLTRMKDGSAVLLVGFNETSVGIMDPVSGTIYTIRNNSAAEWFEENGNQFITYMRDE